MYDKKLRCCCDSRSYCSLHAAVRATEKLITVIAASRPVNKNVSTDAVIRAKGKEVQRAGRS